MSSQQVPQPYFEFDGIFQIRDHTLFFAVVFFSAILLVLLILIYTRLVCRFSTPPPPVSPTSAANDPPAPPHPSPGWGLDVAMIDRVPIVLYESVAAGGGKCSEAECCICLGAFEDKEEVKLLPTCRHCFHSECLDKWLRAQSSCPLCRSSPGVDPPV